jgi:hypothetical protein
MVEIAMANFLVFKINLKTVSFNYELVKKRSKIIRLFYKNRL